MKGFFAIPKADTYFLVMTALVTVVGAGPFIDVVRGRGSMLDWVLAILVTINWVIAAIALTRRYRQQRNRL